MRILFIIVVFTIVSAHPSCLRLERLVLISLVAPRTVSILSHQLLEDKTPHRFMFFRAFMHCARVRIPVLDPQHSCWFKQVDTLLELCDSWRSTVPLKTFGAPSTLRNTQNPSTWNLFKGTRFKDFCDSTNYERTKRRSQRGSSWMLPSLRAEHSHPNFSLLFFVNSRQHVFRARSCPAKPVLSNQSDQCWTAHLPRLVLRLSGHLESATHLGHRWCAVRQPQWTHDRALSWYWSFLGGTIAGGSASNWTVIFVQITLVRRLLSRERAGPIWEDFENVSSITIFSLTNLTWTKLANHFDLALAGNWWLCELRRKCSSFSCSRQIGIRGGGYGVCSTSCCLLWIVRAVPKFKYCFNWDMFSFWSVAIRSLTFTSLQKYLLTEHKLNIVRLPNTDQQCWLCPFSWHSWDSNAFWDTNWQTSLLTIMFSSGFATTLFALKT